MKKANISALLASRSPAVRRPRPRRYASVTGHQPAEVCPTLVQRRDRLRRTPPPALGEVCPPHCEGAAQGEADGLCRSAREPISCAARSLLDRDVSVAGPTLPLLERAMLGGAAPAGTAAHCIRSPPCTAFTCNPVNIEGPMPT